ncbi:hypothetical protein [Streptomyces rubiginosohelvolus]
MAVRTSVGRAATEAHMTTLAAAGVDLVVVSSSPRECPRTSASTRAASGS